MTSKALKNVALKAGLIDLDMLALIDDLSNKDNGTAEAANELVSALKESKPNLFYNDTATCPRASAPNFGKITPKDFRTARHRPSRCRPMSRRRT
jgi:hypothetical protein